MAPIQKVNKPDVSDGTIFVCVRACVGSRLRTLAQDQRPYREFYSATATHFIIYCVFFIN